MVHDPVTPSMATGQPHVGAREGLEPLESDLDGSNGPYLSTGQLWLVYYGHFQLVHDPMT